MIRIFLLAGLLLVGCAGRSVPALIAKDLQFERFPELAPRAIAPTVEEGRATPPEKSAEIVARVRTAVAERLRQDGITVSEGAPHALTLRLMAVEQPEPGFRPTQCVLVRADFRTARGARLWGEGSACYAYKHAFGFSISMPSRTYREALNFVLRKLSAALADLPVALRSDPASSGSS